MSSPVSHTREIWCCWRELCRGATLPGGAREGEAPPVRGGGRFGAPSSSELLVSHLEGLAGRFKEFEAESFCKGICQACTVATFHFEEGGRAGDPQQRLLWCLEWFEPRHYGEGRGAFCSEVRSHLSRQHSSRGKSRRVRTFVMVTRGAFPSLDILFHFVNTRVYRRFKSAPLFKQT